MRISTFRGRAVGAAGLSIVLAGIVYGIVTSRLPFDSPEARMYRTEADMARPLKVEMLVVWILVAGLIVPFGACIMFYGTMARGELVKAIETLLHQLPRLITILLFAWAVSCFAQAMMGRLPVWASPLVIVIEGYADCVVFSTTWLVCMVHRDEEPEDEQRRGLGGCVRAMHRIRALGSGN